MTLPQANTVPHDNPTRFGVAGLGGYAAYVCQVLSTASAEDPTKRSVQFTAVCEPALKLHAVKADALRKQGVHVIRDYAELLRQPIDAVWLPVPIHLHRRFTEQALAAGKAVLCEKPAAGTVQDVDAMIAARERSGLPVAIAYQHMYDPAMLDLKRRLLNGGVGRIQTATVMGCWPRDSVYFSRNGWAGHLQCEGEWVLDSPLSNAMSHYMQLALFLLGPTEFETANPLRVEAELYRANAIENFDTCAVRITIDGNVTVLVLLTHACATAINPQIEIEGEKGLAVVQPEERIEWRGTGGTETIPLSRKTRERVLGSFVQWIRGGTPQGAIGTLEVARAPIVVVNAASESVIVRAIGDEHQRVIHGTEESTLRTIKGIERVFESCAREGKMIHEVGGVMWATKGGRMDTQQYREFRGPMRE